MRFADAVAWEPAGPGQWTGEIDPTWLQGRGAFGGLVAAIILRGMASLTDRPPRTLTVHFCGPATGALVLAVEVVSAGRSVTQLSARITHGDAVVATALATFAVGRESPTLDADPPPGAPPWPAGVSLAGAPFAPTFVRNHFDLRFSLGERLFSSAARAETGGRVRFQETPPDDATAIVALLDAWPPGVFPVLSKPVVASSVDLTCHFFRSLPDPAVDVGGAFQFLKRCEQIGEGYAEERGTLWTEAGLPVARVRQLYAFFP